MRTSLLSASALVCMTLLANSAAEAKNTVTYIPVVPPAGAASTVAWGINDHNVIAGSFTDSSGVEHGFYGPLDGSNYTTFDFSGTGVTGTEPRAISNDGSITGFAKGSPFIVGQEFFRAPDGTISVIGKKHYPAFDGVVQGINDAGTFVGDYYSKTGIRVGYKAKHGEYRNRLTIPNHADVISTNPRGKNNVGVFTGSFTDTAGGQHGWTLDHDGNFNVLDYPDAGTQYTAPEGINDSGQVSGLWADSSGNRHGFVVDTATDTWTRVDPGDGSTFQQGWGINNAGLIALNTSNGVSFIYCPLAQQDCPQGGPHAKQVEVHPIHGRPGHKLPPIWTVKKQGNIP